MVDDDPLIHRLYQHHLEQAGFRQVGANNGSAALMAAHCEQPEVIVMDIFMAGMDGLTALRELKSSPATREIPVLIMTANASAHHTRRQEAAALGAAAFMPKPFSPAQLIAEIRRLMPLTQADTSTAKK